MCFREFYVPLVCFYLFFFGNFPVFLLVPVCIFNFLYSVGLHVELHTHTHDVATPRPSLLDRPARIQPPNSLLKDRGSRPTSRYDHGHQDHSWKCE